MNPGLVVEDDEAVGYWCSCSWFVWMQSIARGLNVGYQDNEWKSDTAKDILLCPKHVK